MREPGINKNKCSMRNKVLRYAKKKYGTTPEYLWSKAPEYAVLRHDDNNKWYGLIMNISYDRIDPEKSGDTDVLNVKLKDIMTRDFFVGRDGYYPGYHISRGNWLSVVLDGTVGEEEIYRLLDMSFDNTASKQKKQQYREPKEWIIPANPKYYDIVHAFDNRDIIEWKQGSGIIKGDTVFMYVGAPVSAVLYKCRVIETDIPCDYKSRQLTINKLMRIELQKRYEPDRFTFSRLNEEFGIFAVRGPRGIPHSLSEALKG